MNFFPINRDIYIDGSGSIITNPKDYTSDIRDLKLKIISGDLKFTLSNDMIVKYQKQLEFISDKFSDSVITGSLVLNLFNLINRDIKDIDIIIKKCKTDSSISYIIGNRYGMSEVESSNRLGYINFRYKRSVGFFGFLKRKRKYTVDFFEDDDVSYIEFDFQGKKLKLHNPIDIIIKKVEMGRSKHLIDVNEIFSNLLIT